MGILHIKIEHHHDGLWAKERWYRTALLPRKVTGGKQPLSLFSSLPLALALSLPLTLMCISTPCFTSITLDLWKTTHNLISFHYSNIVALHIHHTNKMNTKNVKFDLKFMTQWNSWGAIQNNDSNFFLLSLYAIIFGKWNPYSHTN